MPTNVLGKALKKCGCSPMTGWYLDGYCREDKSDFGNHVICCVMTEVYLKYTFSQGNNLIEPRSELQFPGLHPGDHWCLCLSRWQEAWQDGVAPPVILESTDYSALKVVSIDILLAFQMKTP